MTNKFVNGFVQPEAGQTAYQTYMEVMTKIYDGHLPISKPIGFYIEEITGSTNGKCLERDFSSMENKIQLASNLSQLVFIPFRDLMAIGSGKIAHVSLEAGAGANIYTGSNCKFMHQMRPVMTIGSNQKVISAINPLKVNLIVADGVGYSSMEDSAKAIAQATSGFTKDSTSYFPLGIDFSLLDYVRICPPDNGKVRYILDNGMTSDILNRIWERGKNA